MLFRFSSLWIAAGLLVAMWGLDTARRAESTSTLVRPVGSRPGPVRIVQFYASVRILTAGDKAKLCYGVENAKSVRIAPSFEHVNPSFNSCLDIGPDHTTHYTILAEGYDGRVAIKSIVLPVEAAPAPPQILSSKGGPAHASWI